MKLMMIPVVVTAVVGVNAKVRALSPVVSEARLGQAVSIRAGEVVEKNVQAVDDVVNLDVVNVVNFDVGGVLGDGAATVINPLSAVVVSSRVGVLIQSVGSVPFGLIDADVEGDANSVMSVIATIGWQDVVRINPRAADSRGIGDVGVGDNRGVPLVGGECPAYADPDFRVGERVVWRVVDA